MAEPTTANLLTVASYGITGRIEQLIAVHRLLDEMHGPRLNIPDDLAASDFRCKTCRNTSGKPCPWPCDTWVRFADILGMPIGPATIAMFRALGGYRNGRAVPNLHALIDAMLDERDPDDDGYAITGNDLTAIGDNP